MMFFNQNLHFLLMASGSTEVDKSMLRTVDSGAVLSRTLLNYTFMIR
jgi:hypothetical protein